MSQRITVNDLVSEVRGQLDEDSTITISDSGDILPALNRAQNFALDILARHYKDPLLTSTTVTATAGEDEYDIPLDAFEQRILKVEVSVQGSFMELTRIDYQDVANYETSGSASIPGFWAVVGSKFKVIPNSSGAYNFRVWYLKDPLPLVKSQGRINTIVAASQYVIVDTAGSDLSATSDNLASFVNLIDGATGVNKGTLQIQSISGTTITFKTVPTRSTVYDLTVGSTLVGLGVTVDDYICLSSGACVPFLKKPMSNFLVQYAVAELSRKLGGEAGLEEQVLQKFERQIERTWVQRPNAIRVQKRGGAWSQVPRRLPHT